MEYDPAQLPRRRELSARKAEDPESLSMDERRELEALVYAHTNWMLDKMRGKDVS